MACGDQGLETQNGEDVDATAPLSAARQDLWDIVQQWLNDIPPDVLYERMEQLDKCNEYIAWLKAELGTDDNNTIQKTNGSTGTTDLTQLSPNPGRAFGYRTVSVHGLQKKMRDIFIAGEWRPWDIAKLCLVDSNKEPAPKRQKTTNGGEVSAVPAVVEQSIYADFHHRGCALHALCDYHRTGGMPLPHCLKTLATNIRYEWVGTFPSRDALVVQGLASVASLEHGVVKLSWLDIVLEIVGNGPESGYGEALKSKVMSICPEHAMAMADWQHMQALTCRVARSTYAIIERFMLKHRLATPPIPQSWLREQYMLLKGRKGGECCNEREQNLAVLRLLGSIQEIANKQNIDLATSLTLLTRKPELNEQSRKNIVRLTKKYVAGMEATHAHYGHPFDFDDRYASGELDSVIHATSNPALAGRYWAWVKEAEQQRLEAQRSAERRALECAAAAAAKDAEKIASEAQGMQSSLEADVRRRDDEILAKYVDTYTLQLRTFQHVVSGITKDQIGGIEEAWVLHHDTEAQRRDSFAQQCQGRFVVHPRAPGHGTRPSTRTRHC